MINHRFQDFFHKKKRALRGFLGPLDNLFST